MTVDRTFCLGCNMSINNAMYFHVGAPLREINKLWFARQDPDALEPSSAILVEQDGDAVFLLTPEWFPPEAREPVTEMIKANFTHKPVDHDTLLAIYKDVTEAFRHATVAGILRRDYMGRWHYSGTL